MTTETACVPRDELLELLEDGVDDYWITSESGVRIVGTLRAILAQPVASEPVGYFTFCEDKQAWKQGKPKGPEFLHLFTPLYRHPLAPAIPDGWIPVSERLPDECRANVLLYFKERHAITIGLWSDVFHTWEFHHHVDFDEDQLTHWMPLPAGPQPTEGSTDE